MESLLRRAQKEFAEVRSVFPDQGSEIGIVFDQDPGEYRVEIVFDADPVAPMLSVVRLPKRTLASILIGDEREYPLRLRLDFNASFSSDGQFGWLDPSTAESALRSSRDIIETVRSLRCC